MTEASPTPADLKAEIWAAWAGVEAPPAQDMAIMDWEYGEDAVKAFVGVRPADVDISSPGFRVSTPLLELPGNAAAAYLGPYLVAVVRAFQLQEAIGAPVDIKLSAHTIHTLQSPNFWVDIAAPYLSDTCLVVLGKVTKFILAHGEAFQLSEDEARGLERLIRSIERHSRSSGSR